MKSMNDVSNCRRQQLVVFQFIFLNKKFPMLDAEEEYMLAKNWRERGNIKSAHKLVTSYLRLVAKIAMGYRGYGLPVNELIAEGNIGLCRLKNLILIRDLG